MSNDYQEIKIHTAGGWETTRVKIEADKSEAQHAQTFKASDPPGIWRPILGMDLFDSPSAQGVYRSFAYACINKKAFNISKPNIYLYKRERSKKNEVLEHPFLNLIRSRNSYGQSFREIFWLSSCNCDINGHAFILIGTVQTPFLNLGKKGKTPVELIPLAAKYITPVMDSQNIYVDHWLYSAGLKTIKLLPEEVIRFKVPNPDSNILPNPPVKAFNFTLDVDYLQARTRRKFFDNDARPTLHIGFPTQLDPGNFEDYVSRYSRKQSGVSNNGRTIVTDNGATVSALNNGPRELDYANTRRQVLDEIMLMLDVNAQVMGMFEDSNYNNGKNALRGWMENSIIPFSEMVFQEPLNGFIFDYYDKNLLMVLEYDLEYDRDSQIKALEFYSKEGIVKKTKIAELEGFGEDDVPEQSKKQDNNSETPAPEPGQPKQ